MSLHSIGVVYRKELTEALRDRRTLISTIVVPLLLFPVMSVGFASVASMLVGKAKDESPKVMILGGNDSPTLVAELQKLDKVSIVPAAGNWKEIFNSDAQNFWGSGITNTTALKSESVSWHGRDNSINIILPPLGASVFKKV